MKAFVDTSSLLKKYINESGSNEIDQILENVTEITVAPILKLEIQSSLQRRLNEKSITQIQAEFIKKEFNYDYAFFVRIFWNETLENKASKIIENYNLRTLDGIQLASAILAKTEIFLTSDKKLFEIAKKELKNVVLI